jgi:predicted transcriptional regulator
VLTSEKRKQILLLLTDGPRSLQEFKVYFNVSTPEIIPRIKELQDNNLILRNEDKYYLSPIGNVVVKRIRPLLDLSQVIDVNSQFLAEHDLSPIPEHMLERIDELGECMLIKNDMENITATYRDVLSYLSNAKSVKGISPIFDSGYPEFFLSFARHQIPVSIVLTENIFDKVRNKNPKELEQFLNCENASIYVIEDAKLAFAVTDSIMSISLCSKSGNFDALTNLISSRPSAVKWGEDLFEHYKKNSRKITNA